MVNYLNIKLSDIMPQNLLEDSKVANACKAIDIELHKTAKLCTENLLISRIDELDDEIIDILAWQWHVDFYDTSYPIETKRKLVKQSIAWHRRKGTPSVVKEVVATILKNAAVQENWEYGGNPYCFKVRLVTGEMPEKDVFVKLVKNLQDVKNTRSHLDEISFYREIGGATFIGAAPAVFKKVVIGFPKFKAPKIKESNVMGVATSIYKNILIKGAI